MSPDRERAAFVAWLRLGRHRWEECADLAEATGGAALLLERDLAADGRQGRLYAQDAEPLLTLAERDLAAWDAAGFRMVTVLEPDYPLNLRTVHDRPALIFVAGRLSDADERSIAVIGSRRPTAAGAAAAAALARHLVGSRYAVVSGLATGIDTAAHQATLDAGGRTVAVIGTGLAHAYPAVNAVLQQRISNEGAVISRFWPDAGPSRLSFPQRNAVMSGVALGTVIVEASATSGARTQARIALAHGRPVFLWRSLLVQSWARELAARPGVHVVSQPTDVTDTVDRLTTLVALDE